MDSEVRNNLLDIAKLFYESVKIPDLVVTDIILTGSLANYNWSKYSDVDLHLVVETSNLGVDSEFLDDYFFAKKDSWNKKHNITIHGHDVELYIQKADEQHSSSGVYSVLNDEWNIKPTYNDPEIDIKLIKNKVKSIVGMINHTSQKCDDLPELERIKTKISNMRKVGLKRDGEFSIENLVFKVLRNNGYIEKLYTKYNNAIDDCYSI